MIRKEFRRQFTRGTARFFIMLFYYLFKILPQVFVFGLAKMMLPVFYFLVPRQRQVAVESLTVVYGQEKSVKEIQHLAKESLYNLGMNMSEMIYYFAHPKQMLNVVEYEGREHLDWAIAQGRGVLHVSAHFGNFPLAVGHLGVKGYKTNVILRPQRDEKFGQFLFDRMKENNITSIYSMPRRKCVADTMKVLRNNEHLFLLPDQNFGGDGHIYVDFFGRQAATAVGPIVFALRTNAVILPTFMNRIKGHQHRMTFLAPYVLKKFDTTQETYQYNMQALTKIIEDQINKSPTEWAWMHRRWKTRPEGEV